MPDLKYRPNASDDDETVVEAVCAFELGDFFDIFELIEVFCKIA